MEGYKDDDFSKKIKGGFLMDKWAVWNKENKANLGKIKEKKPSLVYCLTKMFTSNN